MGWMIDVIALLLVGLSAWRGYRRGLVAALVEMVAALLAFLGAALFYAPIGRWISGRWNVPEYFAYVLGALLAAGAIYAVLTVAVVVVNRKLRRKQPENPPPVEGRWTKTNRILGAAFGSVDAMLLVALLVWGYALLYAAWPAGKPDPRGTLSYGLSRLVVRGGAYCAARKATHDPEMSSTVARVVSDPVSSAEDLRQISHNPDAVALAKDRAFTDSVLKSDTDAIQRNAAFTRLARDPQTLRAAERMGWVEAGADADAVRKQLAERLAVFGRNAARIANDPEFQELQRDPAIQEKANQGDYGALLRDPRIQRVMARIMGMGDGK